jgi:hypothetical protein
MEDWFNQSDNGWNEQTHLNNKRRKNGFCFAKNAPGIVNFQFIPATN